jgi:hypothetical protein
MMKKVNFILVAVIMLTATSFKNIPYSGKVTPGTYGVCDCDDMDGQKKPATIQLILNENKTFHYIDQSVPDRKLDITGNWILEHNKIILKDYKNDFAIHDKWTYQSEDQCLKSRNQLNFRRLCLIKPCK